MNCKQYVEPLDLVPSFDSEDPYFAEAMEHAENCPECSGKLKRRLRSEREIRDMMEQMTPVPESVFDKVRSQGRTYRYTRRRMIAITAMAASVLLMVGVSIPGVHYWKSYRQSARLQRLCVLSIRNHEIASAPEYIGADRDQVSRWLTSRLGRLFRLPDVIKISNATWKARRAVLGRHMVAAVEFNIDGKRSTLFSYYPRQYGVEGVMEPPKTEMGYTVAFWQEDGLGYSLVSEATPERVQAAFSSSSSL